MTLAYIAAAIAGALLSALALERAIRYFKRQVDRDIDRMQVATEALSDHLRAVTSLLERHDIDRVLRKFVMDFSRAVLDQKVAARFINVLEDRSPKQGGELDPGFQEFIKSRGAFEERDPKGAELMDLAIRDGVVAMILQWPEHVRAMEKVFAKMAKGAPDSSSAAQAVRLATGSGEPALAN